MIELTDINGRPVYLAPEAISQITEAGVSQAWNHIRSNVQTFDGKWREVQEAPDSIRDQVRKMTSLI
jgi:hypothetical protein